MTTDEAMAMGFCPHCNSYQQIRKEWQCVSTRFPILNYRDTKVGNCALTEAEIKERRKDGRCK